MNFKHLLNFIFIALSTSAFAQVNYSIKAGIGFPTWNHKNQNYDIQLDDFDGTYYTSNTKSITSFYVSGHADYKLRNNFSLQSGISLEGRGGKIPEYQYKSRYLFVNIPLNIVYTIPTGHFGATFLSIGPYAGVNFGGKYTSNDGDGGTFSEKMTFGKYKEMKRFDWGLNFGLGYKFSKGYIINANYNLGLNNMGTQGRYEKLYSRGISFGLGYEF